MGGIQGKLVSGAGNGGSSWGSGLLVHVIVSPRVMSKRREREFVQHSGGVEDFGGLKEQVQRVNASYKTYVQVFWLGPHSAAPGNSYTVPEISK